MNKEKILENIKKYNFYHRIQLTDEIITPGINRAQITKNLKEINKLDLKNKKILDIGCRDGIYCFEAEKLGAKEIIGIDNDVSKAAIEFLIPYFNSKVKMYEKNLFDLKEQDYGKFDVIFFPGTLYHLRYPFHALKIVTDLLKEGGTNNKKANPRGISWMVRSIFKHFSWCGNWLHLSKAIAGVLDNRINLDYMDFYLSFL